MLLRALGLVVVIVVSRRSHSSVCGFLGFLVLFVFVETSLEKAASRFVFSIHSFDTIDARIAIVFAGTAFAFATASLALSAIKGAHAATG